MKLNPVTQDGNSNKIHKYIRSFEIVRTYREMKFHNTFRSQLPKVAKLFIEYQFLDFYFARAPKWQLLLRKLSFSKRVPPSYIMLGPIKSGSSDLVSHMLMHPNVIPPLAKEFRGVKDSEFLLHYPTEKEIATQQAQVKGKVLCGFLDPALHDMATMEKLYRLNPNAKVIITLRNPVHRAYSHWKWEIFLGGKRLLNHPLICNYETYVDRALSLFPSMGVENVSGFQLLHTGIYVDAVGKWINRFGKDNVLVLDVESYFQHRQPVLEKIQAFLELPINEIKPYSLEANENPIQLPKPSEQVNKKLYDFYKPYNEQLFELIGTTFNWHK